MAHGFYLMTERPQAVIVHVNVGTANGICGTINAASDNVPLLLTAGRSPLSDVGDAASQDGMAQWAQEMFDQAGMVIEGLCMAGLFLCAESWLNDTTSNAKPVENGDREPGQIGSGAHLNSARFVTSQLVPFIGRTSLVNQFARSAIGQRDSAAHFGWLSEIRRQGRAADGIGVHPISISPPRPLSVWSGVSLLVARPLSAIVRIIAS